MKTFFVLLVLTCCLGCSSATFELFKNKAKFLQKVIDYLSPTVIIPEPVPARQSYTTHVSTFSVSLPPVEYYAEPITTAYGVPYYQEQSYVSPVGYSEAVAVPAPVLQYEEPETILVEPLRGRLIAGRYVPRPPVYREIGNW